MCNEKDKFLKGIIIAAVSEFIFGMSFVFIKMVVSDVTVMTLLAWRNIIGFTTMTIVIVLGILKLNLKGKNLKPLLLLCCFQPVSYYIFETIGVKMTTASESGMFFASIPIVTMLFSAVFIRDMPNRKQVLFMFVTVSGGIIAAVTSGLDTSGNLAGYFFLLFAMFSESAFAITSQTMKNFTSTEKTYIQICAGTFVFTACAIIEQGFRGTLKESAMLIFTDRTFLICILFLGIGCNVIGFFMANYALPIIGATRRAAFGGIGTITAIIGGVCVLHESFTGIQFFATILILIGAYGVNFSGNRKKEE